MSDETLRSKLIRLAHENPNLRPDLLPLLSKQGSEGSPEVMAALKDLLEFAADELDGSVAHLKSPGFSAFARGRVKVPNLPARPTEDGEITIEIITLDERSQKASYQ